MTLKFEITDSIREIKEVEHGPEFAGYDNIGFTIYNKPCPYIRCICGFETKSNHTWEDVGMEFDEHLAEIENNV